MDSTKPFESRALSNRAPSCYGCVHLSYQGPIGFLPDAEISDEDSGRYYCRKFSMPNRRADETPRPLLDSCKEIL